MKYRIFLFVFIAQLITLYSYSQNDTIWEFKNYIYYKGDTLNQYNCNEQKHGMWLYFTPKNTFMSISVHSGEKSNPHITMIDSMTIYDTDYSIDAKGYYLMGKRDSLWSYYYRDGKLQKEISFNNGEIAKDFIVYYENGNIMMNVKMKECCTYTILQYSSEGKLVKERTICKEEIEKLFPSD